MRSTGNNFRTYFNNALGLFRAVGVFAVILPEHVLQHLPGHQIAIILTGHVLAIQRSICA